MVIVGCAGSRPGNSQPCGRATFHQVRSKSSRLGEEHDVTVLAAFALLDADDHALAVNVGDLERDDFGGAQAGAVGRDSAPPCT